MSEGEAAVVALVDERLTLQAFQSLAGSVGGLAYVKTLVDLQTQAVHFVNDAAYRFHSDYVAERILGIPSAKLDETIDEFNRSVYLSPDRRFLIGTLGLHAAPRKGSSPRTFMSLETVEIDNMGGELLQRFYDAVRARVDPTIELYVKPANQQQEAIVAAIPKARLPRVLAHELFGDAVYVPLHAGKARGRLRVFATEADYRRALSTIEWHDILAMPRVPDDVPRVAGLLGWQRTTPLSHVNVLAHGWGVPNAVQMGAQEELEAAGLDGRWVEYEVDGDAQRVKLTPLEAPPALEKPGWALFRVHIEQPDALSGDIVELSSLRLSDSVRYGTKAANLGELLHVLAHGSPRLLGFYRVKRPPRDNLLEHVARFLGLPDGAEAPTLLSAAHDYLRHHVRVPRGIALPFTMQRELFESSPAIQRALGRLSMALELGAAETPSLCISLQNIVRRARLPDRLRDAIDAEIAGSLGGVTSLVLRSSSNAEDLAGFSAAGIYESRNHVCTAEAVFEGVREVWASLYSPRSVQLRRDAGLPLDDCFMGVIVQEEVQPRPASMGGVLVTTNPMSRARDFRNVYVNVSTHSVVDVVQGAALPMQFLYNTVEGGGRTLSLGAEGKDLALAQHEALQRLSFIGRLLQSHFSPDYGFSTPLDIEWMHDGEALYLLQVRPYAS